MKIITLKDIQQAYDRIKPLIILTDLEFSRYFTKRLGLEIFLKHENYQITGSFKVRGALNKISLLSEREKARGVIAPSAGNHAQGVAFSAQRMGVKSCWVVMPKSTPKVKVEATRSYGSKVILKGEMFDESFDFAKEMACKEGLTLIHPYEDSDIIAGQGTIGLEILEKLPDLDSLVVPVGGGGLISGLAVAVKSINPKCKIYGVVPKNCSMLENRFYNKPAKDFLFLASIADGTAVKRVSDEMLNSYLKSFVDEVVSVSEEEIVESIMFLLEREKTVTEGAGALALAAVLNRKLDLGKKTVLILSGGNIDLNLISKVIERGLAKKS